MIIKYLIFPIKELYHIYIDFVNSLIKSGHFAKADIILNRLREKLNLTLNETTKDKSLLLDEKRIKIELCINKSLYERGSINEAVENGKHLIDLLNNEELNPYNKLNDKIKGKIYGKYAFYRINQLQSNKKKYLIISRQKSDTIRRTFHRHRTNY